MFSLVFVYTFQIVPATIFQLQFSKSGKWARGISPPQKLTANTEICLSVFAVIFCGAILLAFTTPGEQAITGSPYCPPLLSEEQRRDDVQLQKYDLDLRRYMIYHLCPNSTLPAKTEFTQLTEQVATNLIARLIPESSAETKRSIS